MLHFIDYYDLLGVSYTATDEQIKTAFRIQSFRWHPDRNPGVNTNERMQLINEARRILTDPILKADYDVTYSRHSEQTGHENEEHAAYESGDFYEYKESVINDKNLKELYENMCKEKTDLELITIIKNVYEYNPGFINLVVTELIIRNYDPKKIDDMISRQRPPVAERREATTWKFDKSWLWIFLLISLARYLANSHIK